jgi:hypothetical protein
MPIARGRLSGDSVGVDFYSVGGRDAVIGGFGGTNQNQKYTDICQAPANILLGHLTVQGITQPNVRNNGITFTLQLCVTGVPTSTLVAIDNSGNFTHTHSLPNGTYNYSIKGARGLANAGQLTIAGTPSNHEFGTMRGGDSSPNNIVNSVDFNQVRAAFGTANNLATDFNYDGITNSGDFNILRSNFGVSGGVLTCP